MSKLDGPRDHEGRTIDFGTAADDYDRFRPGFPDSFFAALEQRRWTAPGTRVLDLGTGTGTLALGFARRGLVATGLDISAELLAVASARARQDRVPVGFIEGRAEDTGLEAGTFDLVTAGQCWWWFDAARVMREVLRVLAPGGRLIVGNFSYLARPGSLAGQTEQLILQFNPGWTMAGWPGVHPEQVRAIDDGGMRDVESFSYVEEVTFTPETWRGRVRACNAVGASLSNAQVERFDRELAALLEREYGEQIRVPHRIFVASGLKPAD